MRSDQLTELQYAFEADLALASRPETVEFCMNRLAAIAKEMKRRAGEDRGENDSDNGLPGQGIHS